MMLRPFVLAAALAGALGACAKPDASLRTGFAPLHAAQSCLDPTGSPGAGLALTAADCTAHARAWTLLPIAEENGRALYTLSSATENLCIEAPADFQARVRLEPCADQAAQRLRIDAFNRAPSQGLYDVVHTSRASRLTSYQGLILRAPGDNACLAAAADSGAVTLQPCVDPDSGRFNPQAEWAMLTRDVPP